MIKKLFEFKEVDLSTLSDDAFNLFPHKSVLTTKDWIHFIEEDSKATPLILKIIRKSDNQDLGYFSALRVKKFGFKIIGSPFPGWSTPYMGLDVINPLMKADILPNLFEFIKKKYNPSFIQLTDRDISFEEANKLKKKYKYIINTSRTLEIPIDMDDEHLYKQMKTDCRNFIKQFERRGAVIEKVEPNDEFAEDYYNQLIDVFDKQKLVPTWTLNKVKCMLKHLSQNNSVLCLRVRDPEGKSIATSIFPGFGKKMFFFGGASLRPYQHFRPNEYMIYTAMKYWRDRGCSEFDMVGIRQYKKKFGAHEVEYPSFTIPKYKILNTLKNLAARFVYLSGSVKYKWHHFLKIHQS